MILSGPSIIKTLNRRKSRGKSLQIYNNTWNYSSYYSCSSNQFEMYLVNYSCFPKCIENIQLIIAILASVQGLECSQHVTEGRVKTMIILLLQSPLLLFGFKLIHESRSRSQCSSAKLQWIKLTSNLMQGALTTITPLGRVLGNQTNVKLDHCG